MKLSDAVERLVVNQDYARPAEIEGVLHLPLRRHRDDGGSMTELARFTAGDAEGVPGFRVAQNNVSTLAAGTIKAFHLHRRQTDVWFVPPSDRVLVVLSDARAGSPSEGRHVAREILSLLPAADVSGAADIAILFTDIDGYTSLTERLGDGVDGERIGVDPVQVALVVAGGGRADASPGFVTPGPYIE